MLIYYSFQSLTLMIFFLSVFRHLVKRYLDLTNEPIEEITPNIHSLGNRKSFRKIHIFANEIKFLLFLQNFY